MNLTSPPLPATCTDTTTTARVHEPLPERAVPDRRLHRARATRRAPRRACSRPTACRRATGAARRLHARPRAPLLPGAVPAQRRPPEPLRDRLGRRRPDDGHYDTRQLPIYEYLHERGHPDYVISDRFFQAAFGGSFLNHQWLVAAATPVFYNARTTVADDLHSLVDANGMPTSYPLYTATGPVKDAALTVPCASPHPAGLACGDYAVNTIQPLYQPYAPGTAEARRLPPQTAPDDRRPAEREGHRLGVVLGRLVERQRRRRRAGLDERHHAGNLHRPRDRHRRGVAELPEQAVPVPPPVVQLLQGVRARAPRRAAQHLRDEEEFEALAAASRRHCRLKPVSLIKPIGAENEHPGYASEHTRLRPPRRPAERGRSGRAAPRTRWSSSPTTSSAASGITSRRRVRARRTPGPHDEMGPSTRIPALTIAPGPAATRSAVDHASHDTTSIMATIEHRFGLRPVSSRDAPVQDLSTVFGDRHR